MSFAYNIAKKLKNQPKLKRLVKNTYQKIGGIISNKKTTPNTIVCRSDTNYTNLFGYYDKSPWSHDGKKMLYLRVPSAHKNADSCEKSEVIVKDLVHDSETVIATTSSWNVQQGCMLQWLGNNDTEIIYNDFRENRLCSVILNIADRSERIINYPVYSVSRNGKFVLTLDFLRLHTLRPGYGYCNLVDKTADKMLPTGACIYYVNLKSNESSPIITYEQLASLRHLNTMDGAYHKVNHIMLNPNGDRFIFMHRWLQNGVKHDRLLSANVDGSNIRILLDYDMVSHCNWKNNREIIAFANYKGTGYHYYTFYDAEDINCKNINKMPDVDGHPSYSPDGRYVLTDTYPSFKRKQMLYIYDTKTEECKIVASIYANLNYINETRCDLHPRWKYDGTEICFDGAQQKSRQVYTLNVNGETV